MVRVVWCVLSRVCCGVGGLLRCVVGVVWWVLSGVLGYTVGVV